VAAAGAAVLVLVVRPSLFAASDLRALDLCLALAVTTAAVHVVPLPPRLLDIISPHAREFDAAMALDVRTGWRALSVDPAASRHALMVFASGVAVFWCARQAFHAGGIRIAARAVALMGLLASLIGILQNASRTRLVYWWWAPLSDGPPGFGPFINRNHFAAWVVMALALTTGYLAARTRASGALDGFRSFTARLRRRLDLRTIWLLLSIGVMTVALVLSLSRSGLAAGAAAVAAASLIRRGGARRTRRWLVLAGAAVVLGLAVLWTGPAALADRWQSVEIGQAGRSIIWRETIAIVRDFWIAGSGAGTYGSAMTLYQRSDRDRVHFNQAHNHYLQVLAEGGVWLTAICAAAAFLFVRAARSRLRADRTGMSWLRTGAAAGVAGLAVHSMWETAARLPANALLFAVLAAIVLHEPRPPAHHGHAADRHSGS
jgi:hypothetical protein